MEKESLINTDFHPPLDKICFFFSNYDILYYWNENRLFI